MIAPTDDDPVVLEFAERLAPGPHALRAGIHEADEMYSYNLRLLRGSRTAAAMLYYLKGWQIEQTIRAIASWYFGAIGSVAAFLDVASGFGRVTRFLVRELDPARICVAEIQSAAVEFQRGYFGVDGVVSTTDVLGLEPARRFPFVMATSFFSHMPDGSFRAWVQRLLECVEPGGVLAFSANDVAWLGPAGAAGGEFAFVPESETDRLEKTAYGTSYVSESYVRRAVVAAGFGNWSVSRIPRGLAGLQDLYLVAGREGPGPGDREALFYPWGETDRYEIRGGRLAAAGWVETVPGAPAIESVEFFVNNDPAETCVLRPAGPGRARWSFDSDLAGIQPDDVLSVRAMAGTRLENFLALATLRGNPPSRGDVGSLSPRRRR